MGGARTHKAAEREYALLAHKRDCERRPALAHCFSFIGAIKVEQSPLERPSRVCSMTPPTRLTKDGAYSTIKWRIESLVWRLGTVGGPRRLESDNFGYGKYDFWFYFILHTNDIDTSALEIACVSKFHVMFGMETIDLCLQLLDVHREPAMKRRVLEFVLTHAAALEC